MAFIIFPNCIAYPHQYNWRNQLQKLRKKQLKLLRTVVNMKTSLVMLVLEAHRRAGKDIFAISMLAEQSYLETGNYYYFLPEKQQARAILVDGVDADGRPVKSYIPPEIVLRWDMQGLKCYVKSKDYKKVNGIEYGVSTIEFKGSDVDKMVGSSIKGAIFSEFAISNPRVWSYMSMSIRRNNGWVVFISTPRGYNHFYDLQVKAKGEMAREDGLSYTESLTILDTKGNDGNPLFTEEDIEVAIRNGECESWEQAQQEYYCSKDVANQGAWYKEQLRILKEEKRYGDFQADPMYPIHVSFDLGMKDKQVLWFFQYYNGKFTHLMHYAMNYQAPKHYMDFIRNLFKTDYRGYDLGTLFLPHDAKKTEAISNTSQLEWWGSKGFDTYPVPKTASKTKAIDLVRESLKDCYFDYGVSYGFEMLNRYSKKFDKANNRYIDVVDESDDANHYADSYECGIRGMLLYQGIRNGEKVDYGNNPFDAFN